MTFNPDNLRKLGFDEESILDKQNAFIPKKNDNFSESSDVLVKLIEEYNTEFSLISNISLNEKIKDIGSYIHIGWVFEDLLALDKNTGEIVTLVYWDINEINFKCAVNSKSFLEAFLIHGIGRVDMISSEKEGCDYNRSRAQEAAKAAGGNDYLKFWESLYAIDDY